MFGRRNLLRRQLGSVLIRPGLPLNHAWPAETASQQFTGVNCNSGQIVGACVRRTAATRPPFRRADEPLANGHPLHWLDRVCRSTRSQVDRPLRRLPQSVGPGRNNQRVCLPTDFGAALMPRDAYRRRTFTRTRLQGCGDEVGRNRCTDKKPGREYRPGGDQ